jgi:hypothetical protein
MSMQNEAVLERALTLGWTTFKRAWPLLFVAMLALIVATIPGSLVAQVIQIVGTFVGRSANSPNAPMIAMLIAMAVSWLISAAVVWPVQAGGYAAAARAARGRPHDFAAILSGFRRFMPVFGANFVLSVVTFVIYLPLLALSWGAIWPWIESGGMQLPDFTKLSVVPTIVAGVVCFVLHNLVFVRTMLTLPRAADPDLPPIGAIDAVLFSLKATKGHTLIGIGVLILMSTVVVLGFLLCCVGAFVVGAPLALALNVGFYRALLNDPDLPPEGVLSAEPWTGPTPPQSPV